MKDRIYIVSYKLEDREGYYQYSTERSMLDAADRAEQLQRHSRVAATSIQVRVRNEDTDIDWWGV